MAQFNGTVEQIENNTNKITAITGTEKDSNTYPTIKAVIDYVKGQVPSVDTDLSETSENPVQNKVITSYINTLNNTVQGKVDTSRISGNVSAQGSLIPTNAAVIDYVRGQVPPIDTDLSETSENPVQNKVITEYINMLSDGVNNTVNTSQISDDVTQSSAQYSLIPTNAAVRNYVAAEIAKIAVYNGESEDL